MNYYKLIKDNNVIGVGMMWLQWNQSNSRYFYCDMNVAEAVENAITGVYYTADWLKDPPQGAEHLEEVTVEIIQHSEYEELYEQLYDGETIPVPVDPEPGQELQPAPEEPAQEQPMTIAEMRAKIIELEEALNILLGVVGGNT